MMFYGRCGLWIWTVLQCLKGITGGFTWVLEPSIANGLSIAGRMTTVDNVNLGQCIVECYMDEACVTVGVSEADLACQLYSLDLESHQHLINQASTTFYKAVCTNQAYTYVRSINKCIRRQSTPTSYADARTDCQSDGGDLMTVKTNDVRLYLKKIMLAVTRTDKYWLGASQTPGNNTSWTWVDGTEMTNANGGIFWVEDQPDNASEECLQIVEIYGDALFIDEDCTNSASFFCEI